MTEEAESVPIQANLIKEAWIKLAADKDVIHALRTLSNEEVRNALLTDVEWREFVGLVSGDEGVPPGSTHRSMTVTNLIQTSFLVHLSVWFVLVSLALSAWIWWFGMRRAWWGQPECYKCNYPLGKRISQSSRSESPERISNINYSKEIGSLHESTIGDKCDCPDCSGYQLNSHSVEDCVSAACCNVSQHSQTPQNVPPEEPSEECEDRSDPQDPIMYPARVSIESENRKERTLRKSSRTKRSSRSESSKKSKRTIRQSSKTLKKLEKSASSLVDRETNAKLLGRGNGTTKFLAPWVMKE
uniref:Uncharacterized protein n=1 Tax=Lygus hesperus TaxID=30085 RepID=A0A0A9X5Y4_LYGHE